MLQNPKPRIFLDSNVIFSGLYSSEGAPGIILKLFVDGKLDVVISQQVLEEVVQTVKEKLPEALSSLRKLLISVTPEIVEAPPSREVARWSKIVSLEDASILAAAVLAKPDYLVTGDKDLLRNSSSAEKSGLAIVSPAQFLKRWGKDTLLS